MNKKLLYFLFLLPVMLWGLVFLLYDEKKVEVISGGNVPTSVSAYNDESVGGNSEVELHSSSETISFSCELKDKCPYPYVGVVIYPKDSFLFDFGAYDEVIIDISAENSRRIPIIFTVPAEDYEIPMVCENELKAGTNSYAIPLSEFTTPSWWFKDNNITEHSIKKAGWSEIQSINIQNGSLMKAGESDTITINSLSLKENSTAAFILSFVLIITAELFILAVFLFRRRREKQVIAAPYEVRKTINIKDEELEKLTGYIASHYYEPLNADVLQHNTGVSKKKISSLFKENLGVTLKQYLNIIRMNEAKRLLQESDKPVNEIAFDVGYGNISHFNRSFKTMEQITPLQFRRLKSSQQPVK